MIRLSVPHYTEYNLYVTVVILLKDTTSGVVIANSSFCGWCLQAKFT